MLRLPPTLALCALLCLGTAGEPRPLSASDERLLGLDSAGAAQRESTAGFRELSKAPAGELARFHPAPARLTPRPFDLGLFAARLSLRAPPPGAAPLGDRPFSPACPPQGPPARA